MSTTPTITPSTTPLAKALIIWINERVPVPILVWAMLMYFTGAKLAQFIETGTAYFVTYDVLGMFAMASYFIMMRALDEHKDFEDDNKNYPDRPVQRGLVSLRHLKGVVIACVLLQLGTSLVFDQGIGAVTLLWGLTIFWLALMTKEFFIEHWLRTHIVVYALSHMFIMMLIAWWILQMGASASMIDPVKHWPFLALLFVTAIMGELIRKTHANEAEREGVDSYSKVFGYKGSIALVCLSLLGSFFIHHYYFSLFTQQLWSTYSLILLGIYSVTTIVLLSFVFKPSVFGRKLNEASIGLSSFSGFILLISAVLQHSSLA